MRSRFLLISSTALLAGTLVAAGQVTIDRKGGGGNSQPGISQGESGQDQPKVPHIGWNEVEIAPMSALMAALESPTDFYFVHSYYAPLSATQSVTTGVCDYGVRFCAALERQNIAAVQFHPEKSQLGGMKLLETFLAVGG